MNKYYYLDTQGQSVGSYSFAELRQFEASGSIRDETMVAAEGDKEWKPWQAVRQSAVCPRCGMALAEPGMPCSKCESPPPPPPPGGLLNKLREAKDDGLKALRIIAARPIQGVPEATASLGEKGARQAGLFLMACTVILVNAGFYIGVPQDAKGLIFSNLLRLLLAGVAFCLGLTGAIAGLRSVMRGKGSLGSDCLLTGTLLLPAGCWGIVMAITGVLSPTCLIVFFIATALTQTLLVAACARTMELSDWAAISASLLISIAANLIAALVIGALAYRVVEGLMKELDKMKFTPFG